MSFKQLVINLPLYRHLFAGNIRPFGLSPSISDAAFLLFSWAALLEGNRECMCLCYVYKSVYAFGKLEAEGGHGWVHCACSSLQSDLLVLIGKDSSNKHRGVVVTQA